ncbi:hypothetical protein GGD81_003550 [Rhodobium orientis]|uniref:DUF4019 domain-containing protein n=1 Tax=Rhodobium orientis TaxID=34017 RepID=A0A327JGC3_9HYPH|nr:hypothetical protein [Rhodobium orientis]MBB4304491.1 hypothetical protein [Rhodobium orientis]MBK5948082.1 hypothetical protein [Rhodobium orientis]RAI25379.1 hypothetical protein CH339_18545 [Rhodobium orientis]
MKKRLCAFAASAFLAAAAAPAAAAPLDESCALVDALVAGGGAGGVRQLSEMARSWNEADRAKLEPLMLPVLAKFNYARGEVYSIAALGDSLQEHLIVMNLTSSGSVYMRVLYEGNGSGISFINVDFEAKFHDILKKPVLMEPVELPCN